MRTNFGGLRDKAAFVKLCDHGCGEADMSMNSSLPERKPANRHVLFPKADAEQSCSCMAIT